MSTRNDCQPARTWRANIPSRRRYLLSCRIHTIGGILPFVEVPLVEVPMVEPNRTHSWRNCGNRRGW